MKYFQTDDRDDYFASLSPERKTPRVTSLTLSKGEKIILDKVRSFEIRYYYRNNHVTNGSNGKRVWRQKLIELGYTITNNY